MSCCFMNGQNLTEFSFEEHECCRCLSDAFSSNGRFYKSQKNHIFWIYFRQNWPINYFISALVILSQMFSLLMYSSQVFICRPSYTKVIPLTFPSLHVFLRWRGRVGCVPAACRGWVRKLQRGVHGVSEGPAGAGPAAQATVWSPIEIYSIAPL